MSLKIDSMLTSGFGEVRLHDAEIEYINSYISKYRLEGCDEPTFLPDISIRFDWIPGFGFQKYIIIDQCEHPIPEM